MTLIPKITFIVTASMLATACGGGGGSGGGSPDSTSEGADRTTDTPSEVSVAAPEPGQLNVSSTETTLAFSHPNPDNVDSYQAYSATEAISDKENFAIFAGAQLDLDIESPHTISTPEIAQVYHTYLTAVNGDTESELSSRVISVPRYEIIEEGDWVRDLATNLEWRRCFIGAEYNADQDACIGTPTRLFFDEAETAAANAGGRMPGIQEMIGLTYCDNGRQARFVSNNQPSDFNDANCGDTPDEESGPGPFNFGHNTNFFPNTPTDVGYWSRTFCFELTGAARDRYFINFGDRVSCGNSEALFLLLRPVRDTTN